MQHRAAPAFPPPPATGGQPRGFLVSPRCGHSSQTTGGRERFSGGFPPARAARKHLEHAGNRRPSHDGVNQPIPRPDVRIPDERVRMTSTTRTREEAAAIARRGWAVTLQRRDEERQMTKQYAAADIGTLTDRELFLFGVGLYWAEGTKDKPHARRERVTFVNSEPDVITVFLSWLHLVGVEPRHLKFRLMIHESADVRGAEEYWADLVGTHRTLFGKTTLKRHNPKTVRKNVGEAYRGCLVVDVAQSADLYRRIEGWWCGIVGAASAPDR
ncbi:hypothetical protein ACFYZ9_33220 [Streptomyces sp. NPDC001691]|uniref:hypothetical protein n=1 Tax=Streptomyces sp. NPDC001691 TaxID=3364600 RepID=UPI0036C76893